MQCNNCGNQIESYTRFCPKCGAPNQLQTPSPTPGPQSGFPQTRVMSGPMVQPEKKTSGCVKALVIGGIIVLLLGVGVAVAVYYGYHYAEKALKSSEAYVTAVNALKQNSEVKEKLGEISDTGFPIGSYSEDADGSGKASFTMSIQGTKGSGRYNVTLVRENRVWRVVSGDVRTANGEVIRIETGVIGSVENQNENSNAGIQENVNARGAAKGGILNSKAISLPKPAYPPIARAAKASGTVVVQVLIDEKGNVVLTHAVSGHPLLQAAAVAAARQAKFEPTKVSGKPVKVSGVIIYKFTVE